MVTAEKWRLVDPKDDLEVRPLEKNHFPSVQLASSPLASEEWASTESGLHRLLASNILANYARTTSTRHGKEVVAYVPCQTASPSNWGGGFQFATFF